MNDKQQFAFTKLNYLLLIGATLIVAIGFIAMAGGRAVEPNDFYPDGNPANTPEIFSAVRITFSTIMVILGFALGIVAIMADARHPFFARFCKKSQNEYKITE